MQVFKSLVILIFLMSSHFMFAQSDTMFESQNRKAQLIGKGDNPLAEFIKENIIVPKNYSELDTKGTISIQFVVNNQGCVGHVEVIGITELDQEYEDAAVDVIQKTDCNWVPATQLGKPVSMQILVPITFNNPGIKSKSKKKK